MREYRLLLSDILQAAQDIQNFTQGKSREDFITDEKTKSAVLYKFAVMGEATKLLPDQVREQYPDIPWRSIAGLRDKVIHGYIGVDYELLWETIDKKNPLVITGLRKILDESN
ncbi:MAG TPA: DUF86 domain-containing protein [Methanoregula sp.]|nr:DUF86 domain-containing protein [Methanoregula sp.]